MADVNAILNLVFEGLIDNSKINRVPYSDGWTPEMALETYFRDDSMGYNADHQREFGLPNDTETEGMLAHIAAWMERHKGRSWWDSVKEA